MEIQVSAQQRIQVGISACLVGENVRFDGGHKRDGYIVDTLSGYFEFVPICPEMAIGLGAPRPALRLAGSVDAPRLVATQNPQQDFTAAMTRYGADCTTRLSHLCGYILKKGSPSCGMERVKRYESDGSARRDATGLFARQLLDGLPNLPIEEEGRLHNPVLRENFILRVYVYHRWSEMRRTGLTAAKLIHFHAENKLLVMAHNQLAARRLGQLVASAGDYPIDELAAQYVSLLMDTLKRPTTRQRHANALLHLMGFIKHSLNSADKTELLSLLDAYRTGQVPIIAPMILFKHHLRNTESGYAHRQRYLQPYPDALQLRNAI